MKKLYVATYRTTNGNCSTAVVRTKSRGNIQSLLERFARSKVKILGIPHQVDDIREGVIYDSQADSGCSDCAEEGAYHPFPRDKVGIRN